MKTMKKERIFNYELVTVEHSIRVAQSSVVIVEEKDIVESDKKQFCDGRNKEVGRVYTTREQNKNHNPI